VDTTNCGRTEISHAFLRREVTKYLQSISLITFLEAGMAAQQHPLEWWCCMLHGQLTYM